MPEARYDVIGTRYAAMRREDPRIAAVVHAALGDARTVVNVGAGAGSYEPRDRHVIAIEPSEVMIAQRVLHEHARASTSGFARMPEEVVDRVVRDVESDLRDGTWDARHGHLRALDEYDAGLRLVVSRQPSGAVSRSSGLSRGGASSRGS